MSKLATRLQNEAGQVIALVAVSMVVLIGITAMVVDLGFAYAAQRNLQSSADEAALAGAQGLPDLDSAVSYAESYGSNGKNAHPNFGSVNENVTTTCVDGTASCADDAVVVSEVSQPHTFFARVLGVQLFTISVKAVACKDPISGAVQLINSSYTGNGCAALPTSNPTPPTTTTATTTTAPPPTTTAPTTTAPTPPNTNTPTLATKLSATPVTVGTSVNDTATLSGATSDAGGTVSYIIFADSGCTQNPVNAGTVNVSHGVVPNSNGIVFSNPGTFYWQASYSGDSKNKPAVSPCTSEPLPVYGDCTLGYPDTSHNPLSSTVFNESTTLRAFAPAIAGPGGTIKVWYNDEHALTLGISAVTVKTRTRTTTTNYSVSKLTTDPSSVTNPAVGATMAQNGVDVSGRPIYPALFITDITGNTSSRAGDWQQGSTNAIPPNAVFGSWKSATETIDDTTSPPTVTVTPASDPAKNNWSLGSGADTPPSGFSSLLNEGYGAEARWNVNNLGLQPGHAYRMEFMVHDGDQNKAGGDSGEACMTVVMPST